MSTFSFGRKAAKLIADEQAVALATKDPQSAKVAYEALRIFLNNLSNNDMQRLPRVELWEKARTQRLLDFEAVVTSLNKVDPNRLLPEDVALLKNAVYTKAAEGALICAQEAMEHWDGPGRYTSYAKSTFKETCAIIEQVIRKQFDPEYARAAGVEAEIDLTRIAFPNQPFENPKLTQALRTLERAWKSATKHPTSVEDRYLLEQIVLSWLPESWSLIRGFESYSDQLRERVEANVLEQLTLITEQVQELLDRNQQSFLGRLEAHTQFLRERRRNQAGSNLSLSRGEETSQKAIETAASASSAPSGVDAEAVEGDFYYEGSDGDDGDEGISLEPEENKTLKFMKQTW